MIQRWLRFSPVAVLALLLISCGETGGNNNTGGVAGYKETKSMVLDILKTEEAQKVIQDANKFQLGGQTSKLLSTGDGMQIQMAVKEVLTNTDQTKLIQQLAADPRFAGDFAKASMLQIKQIQKDLIKDPEYQKSILDVMKNDEFQRLVADSMKATEYRQQVMTVIQDALQSPLYKAELINLMKKALEENAIQARSAGGQGKQKNGGQGGGQGDQKSGEQEEGEGQKEESDKQSESKQKQEGEQGQDQEQQQ